MNDKNGGRAGRIIVQIAVATALAGGSGAAFADRWGLQLGGGVADHDMKKGDIGVVWDPNWTWWEIGGWHFAFVAEGHVSYWRYTGDHAINDSVWEVGATPIIRFIKSAGYVRPFVEVGAGVRFLSHPTISQNYSMSTSFQFADMVGIGAQFGNRQQYQAGVRLQHVSNAGIKDPNPGINFSQLYVQYNF
ncbi:MULTISPECIES: acyloxyacyl hydrolase [Burkholderia]|uniref:Lipid A deacylase n=1 Tax=Burkholderia savannae TaxID=1637837 RepID=A0ABR5TKB9_9BURK|nr:MULTISPECIES: acyloxyacyl hydrolase [Burkholderia]AOJ70054.1 deacylase [Burkholderia savannae]AOJ82027.1 deacylase [Burkholderia savannae]AOK48175.1 deacylase [Burkholderia sp. MSMB617WGS]KVG43953.1 deacylase [Burkholderia sp. MSMB0265]KVG83854.1 deacylase [Burkholderia sp. MSMB2040]